MKEQNIKKMTLQHQINSKGIKVATLEARNSKFMNKLEFEKVMETKIKQISTTYSKMFVSSVPNKSNVKLLFDEMLNQSISCKNFDIEGSESVLRKKLIGVLKAPAWSVLNEMLDKELKNVDKMLNTPKINSLNHECYEYTLANARTEHILLMLEIKKVLKLYEDCNIKYANEFEPFYETFLTKFKSCHGDNHHEELFDEYIAANFKKSVLEGEINYLRQEIQNMKSQIIENQNKINANEPIIQTFVEHNNNITQYFDTIQSNLSNLNQIKIKLNHCCKSIIHIVDNLRMSRANINLNATVESFFSDESVFCSTKIDNLENTTMDVTLK